MIKILFSLLVITLSQLLTACSTPSAHAAFEGVEQVKSTASIVPPLVPKVPIASPLWFVPPLSSLPESSSRVLKSRFKRVNWNDLPNWSEDDFSHFFGLFLNNCQGLMRATGGNLAQPARANPRVWQPICTAAFKIAKTAKANDPQYARQFLQNSLQPWRVEPPEGQTAANLVTGYYEPLIHGSRQQGGKYLWPLYKVPADLLTIDLGEVYPELAGKRIRGKLIGNRVVPYDTRAVLNRPDRQPTAIVWIDNPIDAYFLQIQGSGRVLLTDGPDAGQTIRLAYADHNGRPYLSIAQWLINKKELLPHKASMQEIRLWAQRHPSRVAQMLNANPAMVFFQEEKITDVTQGPKGAYGIALSAQRSIAVDTGFIPLGSPVFLATTWPASNKPLHRLVFAQDTGAAIKGVDRADFYWGFGETAGQQAGRTKQKGRMWVLWPQNAGLPSAR